MTLRALLALALSASPRQARHVQRPDSLVLEPCQVARIKGDARCGTYWVYEDRVRHTGKRIPLKVIVIPSKRDAPRPDPILIVSPGGPGSTNSEDAARYLPNSIHVVAHGGHVPGGSCIDAMEVAFVNAASAAAVDAACVAAMTRRPFTLPH